jgi:hypothetical protein
MRCDICKVIESNHAGILSGMFVVIPNGLAEKAAFVFDWKEAINSDTDLEEAGSATRHVRNMIEKAKYPFIWCDTLCVSESLKGINAGDGKKIKVYVNRIKYLEDDNFLIQFIDECGQNGVLNLEIIGKESSCAYDNEERQIVYRSYDDLSKALEENRLYFGDGDITKENPEAAKIVRKHNPWAHELVSEES